MNTQNNVKPATWWEKLHGNVAAFLMLTSLAITSFLVAVAVEVFERYITDAANILRPSSMLLYVALPMLGLLITDFCFFLWYHLRPSKGYAQIKKTHTKFFFGYLLNVGVIFCLTAITFSISFALGYVWSLVFLAIALILAVVKISQWLSTFKAVRSGGGQGLCPEDME